MRNSEYLVPVVAKDRACPINGYATKAVRIRVSKDPLRFNHSVHLCESDYHIELNSLNSGSNLSNYDIYTSVANIHSPDTIIAEFDSIQNQFKANITGNYIIKTVLSNKIDTTLCPVIKADTLFLFNSDSMELAKPMKPDFDIISPKNQCFNSNSFTFTDRSAKDTSTIDRWTWFRNNNSFSNVQNPADIHFRNMGIHAVSLTVAYKNGCVSHSDTQQIILENVEAIGYSITNPSRCINAQPFQFAHLSKSNLELKSITWQSSENHFSNDSIFIIQFADTGNYSVLHIAEGNYGCKDTTHLNAQVNPMPGSDFTFDPGLNCTFDSISFTNTSFLPESSVASSIWSFGDGTSSNLYQPIPKMYNSSNLYEVRLITRSNRSCRDTMIKTIQIENKPTVEITVNNETQCILENRFNLSNNSSVVGGLIDSLRWNLGDGSFSDLMSFTKSYTDTGDYLVTLTAYANNGCKATTNRLLRTLDEYKAMFSVNQPSQCLNGNEFEFTDMSTRVTDENKIWHLGDGTTSTDMHATQTYSAAGTYNVQLIVNRFSQCADTFSQLVLVAPKPVAISIVGPNLPVNNSGSNFTYTTGGQPNHSYFWSLSGGQINSGQNTRTVNVSWSDSGNQVIQYEITNDAGCKDTTSMNVYVNYVNSVNEISFSDIRFYPNPVSSILHIESKTEINTVVIYDMKGSAVRTFQLVGNQVDFSSLTNGVYTVKIIDIEGRTTIGKVIKES